MKIILRILSLPLAVIAYLIKFSYQWLTKGGLVATNAKTGKWVFKEDLIALERERLRWSLKTFPKANQFSSLLKLDEEKEEIKKALREAAPKEQVLEEYADALMCLFDSAGRAGFDVEEIILAFSRKLSKNKMRKWKKNPDNTYSHVKAS